MTKDKMNELLADAVIRFNESLGLNMTKGVIKLLPTETASRSIMAREEDAFLNTRNALMECGKVISEDRDSGYIEGIIFAGVANMNAAVVVMTVQASVILIYAYAKEGLIKQHTAEKAIERFISSL